MSTQVSDGNRLAGAQTKVVTQLYSLWIWIWRPLEATKELIRGDQLDLGSSRTSGRLAVRPLIADCSSNNNNQI